jgi:hypothetical protein
VSASVLPARAEGPYWGGRADGTVGARKTWTVHDVMTTRVVSAGRATPYHDLVDLLTGCGGVPALTSGMCPRALKT